MDWHYEEVEFLSVHLLRMMMIAIKWNFGVNGFVRFQCEMPISVFFFVFCDVATMMNILTTWGISIWLATHLNNVIKIVISTQTCAHLSQRRWILTIFKLAKREFLQKKKIICYTLGLQTQNFLTKKNIEWNVESCLQRENMWKCIPLWSPTWWGLGWVH